jgi:hypothetical protein
MLINCLNVCNKKKKIKIKLAKRIDLICFLGPVQKLVTSKSAYHLRLEQALKENYEVILQPLENALTINELRKQASILTTKLGIEIKREFREKKDLCKSEEVFFLLKVL